MTDATPPKPRLTVIDRAALRYAIGTGWDYAAIGKRIYATEHEARSIVAKAMEKAGLANRADVARWVEADDARIAALPPEPSRRRPPRARHRNAGATLYRYFDAQGLLLYVGITTAGTTRSAQHASDAEWWPSARSATLEHFATLDEVLEAELVAIREELPLYNRRDHPALVRVRRPAAPRPPSGKPVRTSAWIGQAKRLRGRGMPMPEVAEKLGISAGTIAHELREERRRSKDRLQRSWRDLIRTIHRAGWPQFDLDE